MTESQKNPYVGRGIIFTPEEYGMFENVLVQVVQNAEKFNRPEMKKLALDLMPRLQQAVHAGEGLSERAKKKYDGMLVDAFSQGNFEKFTEVLDAFIQSAARLEADPAKACASILVSALAQLVQAQGVQTTADVLLAPVIAKLDTTAKEVAEGWSPTAADLLKYLRDWVDYGRQNAIEGLPPWPSEDETTESTQDGAEKSDEKENNEDEEKDDEEKDGEDEEDEDEEDEASS